MGWRFLTVLYIAAQLAKAIAGSNPARLVMICKDDIGKQCFLIIQRKTPAGSTECWENTGARIFDVLPDYIVVKLPDGACIKVAHNFCRVLEPRPV